VILVVFLAIKGIVVAKVDLGGLFEVMFCNKLEYVSICNSITQVLNKRDCLRGRRMMFVLTPKY
jgi:hypothetical protein